MATKLGILVHLHCFIFEWSNSTACSLFIRTFCLSSSSGIIQLGNLHASQNTGSQDIKKREYIIVESICKGVLVKGCNKKKMKGGRSVPRMIDEKTRRYKSDSMILKDRNGIHGTVETRSLRSESQRSTECGEKEEKQEIQASRDVTYSSFGRRSDFSTRDNLIPPIPLHSLM